MTKLSIYVPRESAIEQYLSSQQVVYRLTDVTRTNMVFSYDGVIPPLAKVSQLLAMFQPSEYTISKSTTGFAFIIWSL